MNVEIKVGTVEDLKQSFMAVCIANGGNPLWAVDTIEYQFYSRTNEAKEYKAQVDYIKALRLLHGQKQSNY